MNKKLSLNKETLRVLEAPKPKAKQDNAVMKSDLLTRTCTAACD
jgi:hypothetical protein